MRINWFCPLPPARTDIAQYTHRILPELAKAFDVVLWTDQAGWYPRLASIAPVVHFSAASIETNSEARNGLNVYHIGNNIEFHAAIWEASKAIPGVIVLHDLTLLEFLIQYYQVKRADLQGFVDILTNEYGEAALEHWEEHRRGLLPIEYLCSRYPFSTQAVRHALGVFSHSAETPGVLKLSANTPLGFGYLPYRATPGSFDEHMAKYVNCDRYRIVIFGYLGRNRRVDKFLEALGEMEERNRFQVDIFGQLFAEAEIVGAVHRFGLDEQVRIHGFVSDEVLERALNEAHLVANLRYPSMGEASGSQLRIWDHALPSLVTRTRWYATLPEGAVKFVNPGPDEVWDIQVHLKDFLANPLHYAEMGLRGRQLLESYHSPSLYVSHFRAFAEEVRLEQHEPARYLLDRIAKEMCEESGGLPPDTDLERWATNMRQMLA